jgi:hypothetical protein
MNQFELFLSAGCFILIISVVVGWHALDGSDTALWAWFAGLFIVAIGGSWLTRTLFPAVAYIVPPVRWNIWSTPLSKGFVRESILFCDFH